MAEFGTDNDISFPWELGIFDAHCHPTDTLSSIDDILKMKAITLTIMASGGEDQELVSKAASSYGVTDRDLSRWKQSSQRIIPSFGWHPWFSHQIFDDTGEGEKVEKHDHYRNALTPAPEDEGFILHLPDPKPLSTFISETRSRLLQYPFALVGEVGIDRAFRIPNAWLPHEQKNRDASLTPGSREGRKLSIYRVQLSHQKMLLKAQLRLAGEMYRPVSIHSVQAHGAVIEVLQELWAGYEKKVLSKRERKKQDNDMGTCNGDDEEQKPDSESSSIPQPRPFPPRICMHSYSGPTEPLKQFLNASNPAEIFFSFSHVINFSNPSTGKVEEVLKALPEDRILVESDLHCAGQKMDDCLEEIVRSICRLREWPLEKGVRVLGANWSRFVFG
jgi:Tat protein secretion system quality control protein TatD with DNase activity